MGELIAPLCAGRDDKNRLKHTLIGNVNGGKGGESSFNLITDDSLILRYDPAALNKPDM
jgi:hypothetical protein